MIVIGSGPAGNTAAIYLVRNNMNVVILSGSSIGGQLTSTTEVENFPGFPKPILGVELMERIMEQARNLGVKIVYDNVYSVDFSTQPYSLQTEGGDEYIANNIIIASGANPRWLGLETEQKFMGHGVSGCAICDGSFFKGKDVAVVGGGLSATTEALHLAHLVNKVYLINRSEIFRASEKMMDKVRATKNIEIIINSNVIDILGTENPKSVDRVKIYNHVINMEMTIDVSGVFISIGRIPATSVFRDTRLEINKNGYIITESDGTKTNIKGIYAVGDVANKPFKQGVIAAAYGAIAALELQQDLEGI